MHEKISLNSMQSKLCSNKNAVKAECFDIVPRKLLDQPHLQHAMESIIKFAICGKETTYLRRLFATLYTFSGWEGWCVCTSCCLTHPSRSAPSVCHQKNSQCCGSILRNLNGHYMRSREHWWQTVGAKHFSHALRNSEPWVAVDAQQKNNSTPTPQTSMVSDRIMAKKHYAIKSVP